jgi:hypothetical protein
MVRIGIATLLAGFWAVGGVWGDSLSQTIDRHIQARLTAEKIPVSPQASDAEFLRRVYLDLVGTIPPKEKAVAFLNSSDPKKRSKLIDELLASPGFGRHRADIWDNLLFQRSTDNRGVRPDSLTQWLEEKFNANTPWNTLVTELLTAKGSQEENGATTFFLGTQSANKMVDSISRLFMGVRLECAQCHNHPFTGWKQTEYWGMAAFFMKVRIEGNPRNQKDATKTPSVIESNRGRQRNLSESAKVVPPKFFQGEAPDVTGVAELRPIFARWLTSPENKFFARAFVNRVWSELFGRGIVNPVDDMNEDREVTHPELLDELARGFAASGFDVKGLYRAICNSEVYQRTSKPVAGNESDQTLYSHMPIKVLTPEQLYDSLTAVLGEPAGGRQANRPMGNPMRQGGTAREQFVNFFAVSADAKATDYDAGIPQVLRLMNHSFTNRNTEQAVRRLTKGLTKSRAIEELYLTALSRRPTPAEVARMIKYLEKAESLDAGYVDILWTLLNSSEFTLNH